MILLDTNLLIRMTDSTDPVTVHGFSTRGAGESALASPSYQKSGRHQAVESRSVRHEFGRGFILEMCGD